MTTGEKLLVSCLNKSDEKVLAIIQKKWLDETEKKQHKYIMDYYREHGELVDVKTFCDKFKVTVASAKARPAYYLNELKERYIFAVLSDNVPRIVRGLKDDPRASLTELQEVMSMVAVDAVESRDLLYSEDTEKRVLDYEERKRSKGVTYLSMGLPDLDSIFYGYRKQDLITIGGKAGQGKSWLLVFLTHLLEQVLLKMEESLGTPTGEILFITNEMGEEEISERLDCIKFRLPFGRFLKGELTSREQKRYYTGLEELKKRKSKIRIVYACQTIDELTTLIGMYQPMAVFIDGSYLMEGKMQEGWEKIVFITRNLKRLAKNFKCPIINTTQLKRGSNKGKSKVALDGQDDFAYSSSYSQDSDLAIRMFQDADMKFHDIIGCEVVKGRRVISGTTLVFQNDLENMLHSITVPVEEEYEPETIDEY